MTCNQFNKKQKKVLHILYSGLGGHGNVLFSMIDADIDNRLNYEILFTGIEDVREEYIDKCNINKLKWGFIKKQQGIDISFYWKIFQFIMISKPDVVFLHGSGAIIPAWVAQKRHFLSKIIVRETQANHLKKTSEWIFLVISMLLANHIVFLTKEFRDIVKEKIKCFFQNDKVRIIPNGIDLSIYIKNKYNGPFGDKNKIRLGMQSRLVPIKDHKTLLEAIFLLKDKYYFNQIELYIAGDGSTREYLEQLAIDLGINNNVLFLGMINQNGLIRLLNDLDIYIHASMGETMSTALMQAMASRLPLIASDVHGINNMIEHEVTGILVPVKNAQALAEAIHDCITDVDKMQLIAQNAFDFAEKEFSNYKMFNRYLKIMDS
jgi:glycosyltransferase involved in cell wall biosynthesis